MVDIHDIRDINQTLLLHLIREKQPISRGDREGVRPAAGHRLRYRQSPYFERASFTKVPKARRAAGESQRIFTSTVKTLTCWRSTLAFAIRFTPSVISTAAFSSKRQWSPPASRTIF